MPVPRYQPAAKKIKLKEYSPDDLDDLCLSKIIGFALAMSSHNDQSIILDTGRVERNLSLVSKRWYFLTQIQASIHGVYKINLDFLPKPIQPASKLQLPRAALKTPKSAVRSYIYAPANRKPGVLMQRNLGVNNMTMTQQKTPLRPLPLVPDYSLHMFRCLQPKLLKYKHLIIEGTLSGEDFRKLVIALDSARVEHLNLKIKVSKDGSQAKHLTNLPQELGYLKKLVLHWSSETMNNYSNALTWTIFCRAKNLEEFEIHLSDDSTAESMQDKLIDGRNDKIFDRYAHLFQIHSLLRRFVFNRSSDDHATDCPYTAIVKSILDKEDYLTELDTSDSCIVEHLIKSSDRLCTEHKLRFLKFTNPIRSTSTVTRLLGCRSLGTDSLSIIINSLDRFDEIRQSTERFKSVRGTDSVCRIALNLKDKKFPDGEDKIKNIVHLSRLADVTVHISALQRVSIDCCHLMWSVGRGLNISQGKCLFRITVQDDPTMPKARLNCSSEITIPFGGYREFKLNSKREDLVRHREIMRSLKKDCYHQFVKSVRDNVMI